MAKIDSMIDLLVCCCCRATVCLVCSENCGGLSSSPVSSFWIQKKRRVILTLLRQENRSGVPSVVLLRSVRIAVHFRHIVDLWSNANISVCSPLMWPSKASTSVDKTILSERKVLSTERIDERRAPGLPWRKLWDVMCFYSSSGSSSECSDNYSYSVLS
jgi:hypothetical protein